MVDVQNSINYVAKAFSSGCKLVTDNCIVRGLKKFFGWDVKYIPSTTKVESKNLNRECSIYRDLPRMLEDAENAKRNNFTQKYTKIAVDRGMSLDEEDFKHIELAYLASKNEPTENFLPVSETDSSNDSYVYTYSS